MDDPGASSGTLSNARVSVGRANGLAHSVDKGTHGELSSSFVIAREILLRRRVPLEPPFSFKGTDIPRSLLAGDPLRA